MPNLFSPAISLSRVGRQVASQLKHLGIETVQDLLFYFPTRYEDWSRVIAIKDLQPGQMATVRGRVDIIQNKRSRWRKAVLTEAVISDASGSMTVGWFHQPYLAHVLKVGDEIYLSGKIDANRGTEWQMVSPVYEKVGNQNIHTARIVPIYDSTAQLSQKQIRFLIKQALPAIHQVEEWLPAEMINSLKLLPIERALSEIHFPASLEKAEIARRRFKFEELFLLQLLAQVLRRDLQESSAPQITFDEQLTRQFVASLPFTLTDAQRKAAWEILQDMGKTHPMNRLLEGEVGSGKTVVAAIAILNAIRSGYQVAYMAPTEILALQHYKTFCKLFNGFDIKIELITHSTKMLNQESGIMNQGKNKTPNSKFIIHNSNLVIGTHSLIQEKVQFKNLGLAIIDEQHRFGVEQRKMLREKNMASRSPTSGAPEVGLREKLLPHLLSMTATPIPRTLSLAFYGDLDLSFIKELPKERKKVMTYLICDYQTNSTPSFNGGRQAAALQDNRSAGVYPPPVVADFMPAHNFLSREQVYDFIRQEIKNNHRVFILCPLIDSSDKLGYRSVKVEHENLDKNVFPDIEIGLLHGRLKSEEREKLMEDFRSGKKPILVTTTVIEVGVDVPQATVMMIEGADRFGLSQLHQLRGRVGRGEHQSYCFLMIDDPTEGALQRLQAFLDCQDGFALAERDLELRGPGEIWGTAQSGFPEFKIASIKDVDILKEARAAAQEIIKKDPTLQSQLLVRQKLIEFVQMIKAG